MGTVAKQWSPKRIVCKAKPQQTASPVTSTKYESSKPLPDRRWVQMIFCDKIAQKQAAIVSKTVRETYTDTETISGGIFMKNCNHGSHPAIRDYGPEPFVFNINHATNMNQNFRLAVWTGHNMQLTLMSIPVRCDIGVEMHPDVDQFIRIESGQAKVYVGNCKNNLHEVGCVNENYAVVIPAGTWHNIINVGNHPLKIYSIYAPPQHPYGTVHQTKSDAEHH